MRFEKQTGVSIDKAFELYDAKNPIIYKLFEKFAFEWIRTGATKISSKQIIGRIRWHIDVETSDDFKGHDGTVFKCNDAYTSRYSRKFIALNPDYANIFNLRELRDTKPTIDIHE